MIRVLLADDHTIVRESLATALRNSGDCVVVAEAGDGVSAIEQALATEPDVAVVDISMPRLSGIEVVQRLSQVAPETLGQASRIPGVTPAAVAVLNAYLSRLT